MARRKTDEIRDALDEEAALQDEIEFDTYFGRRYPTDDTKFSGEYQNRIGGVMRNWSTSTTQTGGEIESVMEQNTPA